MQTLFVENLVFSGFHGKTGRERLSPQRFACDISLSLDCSRGIESDSLADTYDYKHAVRTAEAVISGTRSELIETVAHRIASHIVNEDLVHDATVRIRKLDAGPECIPGTTITVRRNPQMPFHGFHDFNIAHVIETLDRDGAVSFPLLRDHFRAMLLFEIDRYRYEFEEQPEYVGPHNVREQLSSFHAFPRVSAFRDLARVFEETFISSLGSESETLFHEPLHFNELSLQKYPTGSIGITPHMDQASRINLGCIFMLKGHAQFALCDNRSGAHPRFLDTTPGNVILIRAPGFMHSSFRPFHFVTDVSEERIVFSLRQKKLS